MTPVTGPIERLCRPKCDVKSHNEKLIFHDISHSVIITHSHYEPLNQCLRASHLLDAMKHDGMELVLLLQPDNILLIFISLMGRPTAIYTKYSLYNNLGVTLTTPCSPTGVLCPSTRDGETLDTNKVG